MAWARLSLAAVGLVARPSAFACEFDNEVDPYTEYYNLNGDCASSR